MTAINFMPQFEKPILDGTKIHTLRNTARAKVGDKLQLYTGQRTKACRLIKEVVCTATIRVKFEIDCFNMFPWILDREGLEIFARNDGFDDYSKMLDWFCDNKKQPWAGCVIAWGDAPYLADAPTEKE